MSNIPTEGAYTDKSGTTHATPGTSTVVSAANPNRQYFFIQNTDASGSAIWINFTTAASTTPGASIKIVQNAAFVFESSFVTTEAINVAGEAASMKFVAKEA
jgi:hypothetical protein